MFATRERVRPCRARCSPRSVGRVTWSTSPSCLTSMSRWIRSLSSPLGPLTRTDSGSIETVTPEGTGMGCLPMRHISSPHLRQDLAADAGGAGVVAGHHAVGGGDDRGAHAAEHLGDRLRIDVGAPAGAGHAAQAGDRRAALLGVLEADLDDLAGAALGWVEHRPVLDVALLAEDPCQLALEPRWRHLDGCLRRPDQAA